MRFFWRSKIMHYITSAVFVIATLWFVRLIMSGELELGNVVFYLLLLLYRYTIKNIVKDAQEDLEALRNMVRQLQQEEKGILDQEEIG